MKKFFTLALISGFVFLMAACGANHYTVVKKDGTTMTSVGEPDFSKESSSYSFEDPEGNKVILNREEVQEIQEKGKY